MSNTTSPLSSQIEPRLSRRESVGRFRNRWRQLLAATRRRTSLSNRRQFRKSTTCDNSTEELGSNENFSPSKSSNSTPMNRMRHGGGTRRFSLVKLELPTGDSITHSDDVRPTPAPPASPNLIQKLLFRQFSPKTRPYSMTLASDESVSSTTSTNDTPIVYASGGRRTTTPTTPKHSWASPSSSSSTTHSRADERRDSLFLAPPSVTTPMLQSAELTSYLSRRRNTTGSIPLNKIVDVKGTSTGNALKLAAATGFNNSTGKISCDNIFQTVEDSDLMATKQLINANENVVNSYNEYDWCPLDIAIMLNNIPMIRLLVQYGGEESEKIQPEECRYQNVCHQLALLVQQQQQNNDESGKKSPSNSSVGSKLTADDAQFRRSSPSNESQPRHRRTSRGQQEQQQQQQLQQQQLYQQRTSTLAQMKENYEQAGIPDAPTNVRLMVTGSNSITVTYDEPHRSHGAMVIKYKVEWCANELFDENSAEAPVQSDVVKNCFLREYVIRDLPVGQKCYVRVSAGNMRGFGQPAIANPPYCVPSSWREFSKTARPSISDLRFEEILNKIRPEKMLIDRGIGASTSIISNNSNGLTEGNESPEMSNTVASLRHRRRSYGNLRRNIRQLFQLHPRLAKTMRRGLYLVSVMLNGDRILVTNEDVLPMVEVDENYGHNLLADFQWFMKLSFVWDELKTLRPDIERCSSATTFYLRMKLVQAAIEIQTLQEVNNLGRLHHSYIRDIDGNVAFILINDLSSSNSSNDLRANFCPPNLKWVTMNKFVETMQDESTSNSNNSSLQQIADKLPEMIDFYYASMRRLDSGLYVAYLKMQNSVDCVRVMVNRYMPGSLPCTKIRSVANVSRDEWEWLHRNSTTASYSEVTTPTTETAYDDGGLALFKSQFRDAAKELCHMLNLPETHFSNSRIYDAQVVEIRDDLSLIILMSTADEVNALSTSHPRQSISVDCLTPFMYLPVYIFEVLQHMSNNYRFISQYSRVSICLDFELICAQQLQREAFSINELDDTRSRLNHLLACQQDLDDIWRSSRWLVDVINCAKDKSYAGISLKSWLTFQSPTTVTLKITAMDTATNYASDSALDVVKFGGSTLALPTTVTSTSLSSSFINDRSMMMAHGDSGFIDLETNLSIPSNVDRHSATRASTIASMTSTSTDDAIELTVYIPVLTSNTLVPFKLRTHRMTSCRELIQILHKQQHTLIKSTLSAAFLFVWVRADSREQLVEDGLTAGELENRLARFGGQIHVRTRGLSSSRSSQPLHNASRLSPAMATTSVANASNTTNASTTATSAPGFNLSLNI